MAIVKIRELIGASEKSFKDAIEQLVEHETKKGKNISGVDVVGQTVRVKDGKITEYRVNCKVAYLWKEE